MPDLTTDPFELFKLFQKRDRAIVFEPVDFRLGGYASDSSGDESWRLDLKIMGRQTSYRFYFDFRAAGLSFPIEFDPRTPRSLRYQLKYQAWLFLFAGPLKRRSFFADPANWDAAEKSLHERGRTDIPVVFSCDQGAINIPGFVIEKPTSPHYAGENPWFFVTGDREHVILEQAHILYGTEEARKENIDWATDASIKKTREHLEALLSNYHYRHAERPRRRGDRQVRPRALRSQ